MMCYSHHCSLSSTACHASVRLLSNDTSPPFVYTPIVITRPKIDEVFTDLKLHMVPDEARVTRSERETGVAPMGTSFGTHGVKPYMIPNVAGSPPRLGHKEILQTHH